MRYIKYTMKLEDVSGHCCLSIVRASETHLITYLLIGWERIGVWEGVFANLVMIGDLYGEHLGGIQVEVIGERGVGLRDWKDRSQMTLSF